jgi:hypothetical protein
MVALPGGASGSPFAPVNEPEQGGVIKYRTSDVPSVVLARRQDAFWQMYTACGGPYQIDAEGPRVEGGRVRSHGSRGYTFKPREFWYIQFSCVPPPVPYNEGAPVAEGPPADEPQVPAAPPPAFAQPPPPMAAPPPAAQPQPPAPVAPAQPGPEYGPDYNPDDWSP